MKTCLACLTLALLIVSLPACGNNTNASRSTPQVGDASAAASPAPQIRRVQWSEARAHEGEKVTVVGPVVNYHPTRRGGHVLLNVGKDYPDPDRFTVFIRDEADAPAGYDMGKTIAVTGTVKLYRGVPEIEVTSPSQIAVE